MQTSDGQENVALKTKSQVTVFLLRYILVIFSDPPNTINIVHEELTSCSKWMGCLVWLGYLPYTQVVESSNLSPSISSHAIRTRRHWSITYIFACVLCNNRMRFRFSLATISLVPAKFFSCYAANNIRHSFCLFIIKNSARFASVACRFIVVLVTLHPFVKSLDLSATLHARKHQSARSNAVYSAISAQQIC
jgi:hypothetical protein